MSALRYISRGGASALPVEVLLSAIPSLPRPLLARLVERAIDHMDEQDGDPDLEDDDPSGGSVDDEGEPMPSAWAMPRNAYGIDQREIIGSGWRFDRDDRH